MGRMPKKTRAAASNAVAAEADSGDESAVAPRGGETFGAELELRPEVWGSVGGAPYLSLSRWFVIALVVAVVLGAARSGRLEHRDVAGFVFADEPLSARAWSGCGTWSGAQAVSRNASDAWSADIATLQSKRNEPTLESLVRDRPPNGAAAANIVRDSPTRTPLARSKPFVSVGSTHEGRGRAATHADRSAAPRG